MDASSATRKHGEPPLEPGFDRGYVVHSERLRHPRSFVRARHCLAAQKMVRSEGSVCPMGVSPLGARLGTIKEKSGVDFLVGLSPDTSTRQVLEMRVPDKKPHNLSGITGFPLQKWELVAFPCKSSC